MCQVNSEVFNNGGIQPPPQGHPCKVWYLKMKMRIIFEFPTIDIPRIDITHVFLWYRSQPLLLTPSIPTEAPLWGLGVP